MRKYGMTTGVLAAVFAFGLVACGDDGGDTETDTTQVNDTVGGGDTSDDVMTDTSSEADTTTADPCDPNPCTSPPAATCNGDNTAVVTAASPGTCTDDGGTASCEYTTSETACTDDKICSGGACAEPGDPCDYTFDSKVSYITHLSIGSQAEATAPAKPADDCCFDFNDDGVVDNKLGTLLGLIGGLLGGDLDLNAQVQAQIDGGSVVVLLETLGVDGASDATGVTINGFLGEDADDDLTNNASGTAEFTVNNSSFKPGTKDPLISFGGAEVSGGVLTAGPSLFALSLPIVGVQIDLAITNTRIEAVVSEGPNGNGLVMTGDVLDPDSNEPYGAKLGGVITQADLFNALNGYIATSCVEVTDDDGKLISFVDNKWKCAGSADTSTENCEEDDPATQIVSYCSAAIGIITPDIDTDDDGVKDAISIGLWVKATSATALPDPACSE